MSDLSPRRALVKRLLLAVAALGAIMMASVLSARIAVDSLFKGIASSKSSALSGFGLDSLSTSYPGGAMAGAYQKGSVDPWIARSADLRARSSSFDRSLASLHQTVSVHHGYHEDLRTESRFGFGRVLAATVSVPSSDFDATLADLKTLGRVEGISEAGEDFAVKPPPAPGVSPPRKPISRAFKNCSESARANSATPSLSRKTSHRPMKPWTKPTARIRAWSPRSPSPTSA